MTKDELNTWLAVNFFGWKVETATNVERVFIWPSGQDTTYLQKGDRYVVHSSGVKLTVPTYSSTGHGMLLVVEEMRKKGLYVDIATFQEDYGATVSDLGAVKVSFADASSAPMAVALAAKSALETMKEGK